MSPTPSSDNTPQCVYVLDAEAWDELQKMLTRPRELKPRLITLLSTPTKLDVAAHE